MMVKKLSKRITRVDKAIVITFDDGSHVTIKTHENEKDQLVEL